MILYSALLTPEGDQSVTEDLGADESTLALVAAGIVVIVVAPIAEEFFFRGFFYRALRSRLGILAAAAIDGLVFGLIHFTGPDTLELLPILGALGFMFCLVYERTGTLYSVIGAARVQQLDRLRRRRPRTRPSRVVLGSLMLLGCMLGPRCFHRAPAAAHAERSPRRRSAAILRVPMRRLLLLIALLALPAFAPAAGAQVPEPDPPEVARPTTQGRSRSRAS